MRSRPAYLVLICDGEHIACATRDEVLDALDDWPDAEVIACGPDIARTFWAEQTARDDQARADADAEAQMRAVARHQHCSP
jgi:hypothetical protein